MPKRRPDSAGRELTPETAATLRRALDRFTDRTGCAGHALARALGLDPTDLAPSHLRQRGLLLVWSLRRDQLSPVALQLALDQEGLRALQLLARQVTETAFGHPLVPGAETEALPDVIEAGVVGISLFDAGHWQPAVTHLIPAWERWVATPPSPGSPGYAVAVRVGTQLADWLTYSGRTSDAIRVVRRLLHWAGEYRGSHRHELTALALAYKTCAVACYPHPLHSPGHVLQLSRRAHALLTELGVEPAARVGALRDHAKPILAAALHSGRGDLRAAREASLAVLDEAEEAAMRLTEPAPHELLATRLTRMQCLGVLGDSPQAQQLWDEMLDWLPGDPTQLPLPIRSKVTFTALAVPLAVGDLEAAAAAAASFADHPEHAGLGYRLRRAEAIRERAQQGDLLGARQALLV